MKRLLIVVDMQNDFIDGSLGTPQAKRILPNVKAKVEGYRQRGDDVVFTRDTHGSDYLETQEGRRLPVEHCIVGTEGHRIADGLCPEGCAQGFPESCVQGFPGGCAQGFPKGYAQGFPDGCAQGFSGGCAVFDKPGFGSLELAKKAAASGYDEIELCGLCTDICVVSNALILKAQLPEARVAVDASCCAGVTEESHRAALLTMKMCQVDVVNE